GRFESPGRAGPRHAGGLEGVVAEPEPVNAAAAETTRDRVFGPAPGASQPRCGTPRPEWPTQWPLSPARWAALSAEADSAGSRECRHAPELGCANAEVLFKSGFLYPGGRAKKRAVAPPRQTPPGMAPVGPGVVPAEGLA